MAFSVLPPSQSHRQCPQTPCGRKACSAATQEQLRTWLNHPPWLWLPEAYCTLHNWYPTAKRLVLGSGCILITEERHQSPTTCRKVFLWRFLKLLPFSLSHCPDSARGVQKEAGLPGAFVWYTQVGSKTSARTVLPKMLQRLVDRAMCECT